MSRNKKLSLAVFDLTDCEGCELQFLALRERLVARGQDFEIANWRLLDQGMQHGPFDVTFIEGSPITATDIEVVKRARALSKTVVALGTCAVFGGLQASMPETARPHALSEVYSPKYKTTSKAPKPLSYYIDVDIDLPGCPINPEQLERLLADLSIGKKPETVKHPVCLDCKAAGNVCLFVEEGFCLGPVTRGGCGAACPKAGLACYGCYGPSENANLGALKNVSERYYGTDNLKKSLELFFRSTDQYQEYRLNKDKGGRDAS